METFIVGHSNCLVGVKIIWVKDPGSSPQSSLRLPINTSHKENSHLPSKVVYNIRPNQFPRNTIKYNIHLVNVAHTILKLEIWCGLKNKMARTNRPI